VRHDGGDGRAHPLQRLLVEEERDGPPLNGTHRPQEGIGGGLRRRGDLVDRLRGGRVSDLADTEDEEGQHAAVRPVRVRALE